MLYNRFDDVIRKKVLNRARKRFAEIVTSNQGEYLVIKNIYKLLIDGSRDI